MELKKIKLVNFRNYEKAEISFSQKNAIIGENGQGKTNILDAIYLTLCKKDKISPQRNIRFNQEGARAALEFSANGSSVVAELIIKKDARAYLENKKRCLKKTTPEVVYFRPEDAAIISGAPSKRRSFLNEINSQLDPGYKKDLQEYNRALRQKNILLKEGAAPDQIDPWNESMVRLGAAIYFERKKLCEELEKNTNNQAAPFGEGGVGLKYICQINSKEPEDRFRRLLAQRRSDETTRRTSLVGTHLDDVEITAAGVNLTTYGSHGQQRTVSFLLRMSQARIIEERYKKKPLILIDDLKSELDARHGRLVEEILGGKNQVITTTTDASYSKERFNYIEI